ncbi:DUF6048 family protein [Flavicella sediminum]|uniref:DUF6048 family protein n=1 Tax=Flavicella sediminum TaxID=2585141 RepID=UPI00111CAC54|nr:DUF6048 family protein [Flavicella sediminum]
MLKYIISLCLVFSFITASAQKEKKASVQDSIVYKKKYGLRVGADLSKLIIGARDANFSGLELVADYRLRKDFYLAGEIGFIEKTSEEDNYNFTTKGSYINLGININTFKNWLEMDNEIYYGARYGFSTFSQTLNSYTVFQQGTDTGDLSTAYFKPKTIEANEKFDSLSAHWISFVLGMKVETFKNLYLGASINFSKLLGASEPNNFKNLYIPGFNKVYATNSSVSFNYTISYRIPLYKK